MHFWKYSLLAAFALGAYSVFYEPNVLRINYYEYSSAQIPPEFDGYSIAVLSDIHFSTRHGKSYLEKIIRKTNDIHADLIVGAGDYVRSRNLSEELKIVWSYFQKLKAKDGVVMINGNHDHWAGHLLSLKLLEESGLSIRHRCKILRRRYQSIVIGGAGDFYEDASGIDMALQNTPNTFRIIVAHNPDTADLPRDHRVDLFISGHTHGGQVMIPLLNYAPILPVLNKDYDMGFRKTKKGEDIFISRGIGTSILPLRFNSPPEIPVIVLRSKS